METKTYELDINGKQLVLETGELAQFANGSVLVKFGETTILSTATASDSERPGMSFFPLTVDYEEKMYSVGRIPGGFFKREGRPTENAILNGRAIDRTIRPLFPEGLRRDVVVSNLLLSVDYDYSPKVAALIGASAALAISDIPWNGPVAAAQVGLVEGEIIVNPDYDDFCDSDLDLYVCGTKDKIMMIEAGANEVPEDVMLEAIEAGHKEIQKVCQLLQQMRDEIGKETFEFDSAGAPEDLQNEIKDKYFDQMSEAVLNPDKSQREAAVAEISKSISEYLEEKDPEMVGFTSELTEGVEKAVVRQHLIRNQRRVDGRGLDEVRQLTAKIDLIPRVHGSSLFSRGQTQVLSVVTLGTLSDSQRFDGVNPEERRRYMHHYNFPAYSVGEARGGRGAGRREIGHGHLAETALNPVMPDEEDFPYSIRCVSEVTMSNGSTSQASVCSSSLALMAAGVPIKKPVAGITCGLMSNPEDDNDYITFVDIQGVEDFYGDMDFKVAGTEDGITAIQVDMKIDGLTMDVVRDALEKTKQARIFILHNAMNPVISEARDYLAALAPKIDQIDIPSDKIREIIGSGGKTIRRITEETGTEIDVEEDGPVGHVYIAATDQESAAEAMKIVRTIAYDPEPGTTFKGTVTRLMNFGAFVEIVPGKEGLVHISKMAWGRTDKVEDVVSVGDEVDVTVLEVDDQGRLNLSMRDPSQKPEGYTEQSTERRGGGGGRRDDRSRGRNDRSRGRDNRSRPAPDKGSDTGGFRQNRQRPQDNINKGDRSTREF
ncbi:MAG: polyribonucleotide nucleotidyltransferase [Eubacteriales bacterium]|nr:polyribonucleotide nucleotidyltransferase [Eubacteriales bacterium]